MASPMPPEDQSNTKTEEGMSTFHEKRSRRVSFAENTEVHIFDRDESSEPLPDTEYPSTPSAERDSDNDDDDDMDGSGPMIPFFRVLRSPSSGGSTISATSNDEEDDFIGPVSTSFIRRDLSHSPMSDDGNHDLTMDSTAFSMHFRSLAGSDSEDLRTCTRVHLSFEEKTPTSGTGDTMQLTLVNKRKFQPDVYTTNSQSNNMILVGDYHDKYDYGKTSPSMDPLLAGNHNDLLSVSRISVLKSPIKADQENNIKGTMSDDERKEVVSVKQDETGVADDGSKLLLIRDTLSVKTNEPVKDAFGVNSSLEFLATSQQTPSNHMNMAHQLNKSPFVGSMTCLTDKPSHMLLNGVGLFKSPGTVTPYNNPASVIQRASVSSLQKSISKLRVLEASPSSAALNAKLQDSNTRSFTGLSKMTPFGGLLETETPKNLVASQLILQSENTRSGEHVHQTVLRSPDIRYGYKDDENKLGSTPVNVAGSNDSETKENLTNLSNNIEHEKSQSVGQKKDSLVLNGKMGEKSCQKNLADQFGRSPSNKEPNSVLPNENNDTFYKENVPSEASSVERKRKAENVTADKVVKIKTSSSSGLELASESGMLSIGPNLEHLTKIHTTFFKETKLLPHSVDKMNLHAIDRLVDMLGQLQRSKTYQVLSNEIWSQDKRAAETKLTLCKFVYEHAKLQLMHVKRERLLKNTQLLASGIRECERLKLNSLQNSLDVQLIHQKSSPDNNKDMEECQVGNDKITSVTQTKKDIDTRVSNLTKSFRISCKMKGEPNTADTIANANGYLMKRARCQIIRKDLQLWVIDNLKSNKDHHEVVLNYLDLVTQRLTVTTGAAPRISISNTLNQMNIHKIYKDMDASTAFGFVFNTGLVQKHVTATSMAQETQMTSSLLGNLVDVMKEIQLAKLELNNLIYARFCTSDEHLDLELHFFDSNSRKKATITLNTSCLKRGIYPADVVACVSVDESQTLSNEKLTSEIAAAFKDLRVGFSRILRCISQLLSLHS